MTSNPTAIILHSLAEKRRWCCLLLVVLCFFLYLPGVFTLPATDRDESRFAQASRQMLASGDYVDIHFQKTARHKKPVGIYWLQATSTALWGENTNNPIATYRLPSLLGAIATILAVYIGGCWLFTPLTGLLAALIMASTMLLQVEARLAKTDAMLLATISWSQIIMLRAWLQQSLPRYLAYSFWAVLAAGVLIKGPLIFLVLGGTLLALCVGGEKPRFQPVKWQWLKQLRPLSGLLLFAVLALPWYILVMQRTHGAFAQGSLMEDFIPKLLKGQESHGAPPLYYMAMLPLCFFPAFPLLIAGLPQWWQQRKMPVIRALLCWAVPGWVVFELVPTKLLHYVLPFYPALALLAAHGVVMLLSLNRLPRLSVIGRILAVGSFVLVTLAYAALLPVIGWHIDGHIAPLAVLASIVMLAGMLIAFILWQRQQLLPALGSALVTASLFFILAFQFVLPNLQKPWLGRSLVQIASNTHINLESALVVGISEPSLVIWWGTNIEFTDAAHAADILAEKNVPLIIAEPEWPVFQQYWHGASLREIGRVQAFNMSKGKEMQFLLLAKP
ncbi:MAG: ArnT family glycosyltransferase [Alphaproteobacteria bacterium]